MAKGTVRVVAHVRARAGQEEALAAALRELVGPTRKEKGCIRYYMLRNPQDPADFAFVEEWASDEAIDAHMAAPHVKTALAKAGPLLAGPPDIRRYRVVA